MSPAEVSARVLRTDDRFGFMRWLIVVEAPRLAGWPLGTAITEKGARRKAARMVARARRRI